MRTPPHGFWLLGRFIACGLLFCPPSQAANPYLDVPSNPEILSSPAYRYANASNEDIRQWLIEREIPFRELEAKVAGVRFAGRLTGPLHGVWVHGTNPAETETLPYEIIDGRLALALNDFCEILANDHIVELIHYTIYRPSQKAAWDREGLTRHAGALAIDIGGIKRGDGTWLWIKRDWSASLGAKTCGPGARKPESEFGQQLQSWVCEARRLGVFHYALTPHFDTAHANHLHLEIKPTVKWFLYN